MASISLLVCAQGGALYSFRCHSWHLVWLDGFQHHPCTSYKVTFPILPRHSWHIMALGDSYRSRPLHYRMVSFIGERMDNQVV